MRVCMVGVELRDRHVVFSLCKLDCRLGFRRRLCSKSAECHTQCQLYFLNSVWKEWGTEVGGRCCTLDYC